MTNKVNGSEKLKVEIVETDRFFLYLPVHYAWHAKFFGYIPDRYDVKIRTAGRHTDEFTYKHLMERTDSNRNVHFAICDPTCILKGDLTSRQVSPVVLAGLITNAAFWAINHRSNRVKSFRDLGGFERIIAYQPGTTSYRIAARIFNESRKSVPIGDFIECVSTGRELESLKERKKGTVALSPDVLGIDALLGTQSEYDIEIALGTTPEYMNVLVTALLTREDVISEHADLVHGLLKAIQLSMLRVRYLFPEVIEFAHDYYPDFGPRAPTAIRRATQAQVFPPTIEILEAHWENSARAEILSRQTTISQADEIGFRELYQRHIMPYSKYANKAIRDEILPRLSSDQPTSMEREAFLRQSLPFFSGVCLTAILFVVGISLHWAASVLVAIEILSAYWLYRNFDIGRFSNCVKLHCGIFAVAISLSLLLFYLWLFVRPFGFQPYMTPVLAVIVAALGWDVSLAMKCQRTESQGQK
jgi:hypothetical protein